MQFVGMATNRLQSLAYHLSATSPSPHPFDPLSNAEIEKAVQIIRTEKGSVHYNAITLWEPRKKEMMKWLESPQLVPRPKRIADVVVIAPGGKVYDGLVDLAEGRVVKWKNIDGVQPLVRLIICLILTPFNRRIITDDYSRLPWKISKLLSMLFERIPR